METTDTLVRTEPTRSDRNDTTEADESHIVRGLD